MEGINFVRHIPSASRTKIGYPGRARVAPTLTGAGSMPRAGTLTLPMSAAYSLLNRVDWAATTTVPMRPIGDNDPTMWARRVFGAGSAPAWVKILLGLRQALVGLMGIRRADRGTVFSVDRVVDGEALIDTDDTHLHFVASVRPDPEAGLLHVVTAVEFHGRRGRLYFIPVRFLHDQVLRSMMSKAVKRELGP